MRFRLYRGVLHDCEVGFLDHDSRAIQAVGSVNDSVGAASDGGVGRERSMFFALRGMQTDGERFVGDAITAGAAVVVCARRRACRRAAAVAGVTVIYCRYPQRLMSTCAHLLYGRPSDAMQIVGVTGTDGKSTSSYFTYQLLRLLGVRCGIVSTVMIDVGEGGDGGGAEINPMHVTTPSAPYLHRALASMRRAGYTHAVIETSSHALTDEMARVAHVRYNGAMITNITSEHLEFHRTRRRYRAAKARLFCMLRPSPLPPFLPPFALSAAVPVVQRYLQRIWQRCRTPETDQGAGAARDRATAGGRSSAGIGAVPMRRLISYRIDERGADAAAPIARRRQSGADAAAPTTDGSRVATHHGHQQEAPAGVALCNAIRASVVDHSIDGISVRIVATSFVHNGSSDGAAREQEGGVVADDAAIEVHASFCGVYNAENLLGALCSAHRLTGRPLAEIVPLVDRIALPPGRLQQVSDPQRHPYRVFVDYAHTAAALTAVLGLFRPLTVDGGRLMVLFGSAGMRDREKRGKMGAVAAEYADIIYLTSEDSRGESPQAIVDEIARGIHGRAALRQPQTEIILDREQAIATAVAHLKPHDTLLLLGKGHEQSMISADGEAPWDEVAVAKRHLDAVFGHAAD